MNNTRGIVRTWDDHVSDVNDSDQDDLDDLEYIIHLDPKGRRQRDRPDFMELFNAKEFQKRYRLTKEAVIALEDIVGPGLEYESNKNDPLTPREQLLTTLRYYATGSYQTVVGDLNGTMHQTTAGRVIHRVSDKISVLMKDDYIKFPSTNAEIEDIARRFYMIARFPYVIATMDCTHIPIISPGGPYAELFRNRKKYFSLNVQTLSAPNLKITDIVARWYVSAHDTTIFNNCQKRAEFEAGRYPGKVILGDNGYSCRPYLLTPILNPRGVANRAYNRAQIQTRCTSERQYGVWKRLFPVLRTGFHCTVDHAQAIIVACAILFNFAIDRREEEAPDDPAMRAKIQNAIRRYPPVRARPNQQEGNVAMRNAIIHAHFS